MVLPRQTPSWIMCTDGRLSACRPHEELLFKRPPYKYVRSSPTVLFMILARKRFRAFFDVFWRSGVLACWRSGSGGDEKLCAVDVKKLATRGVMPDISNVQKSPFLKTKTEKGRGKQQKEGRASQ